MKWQWIIRRMCMLFVLTAVIFLFSLQLAEHYPLSPIYRSTHSEKTMVNISKQLNTHRVKNSMRYLKSSARTAGSSLPPSSPQLVVVIITVARRHHEGMEKPRYLTQTLAAMDILLTKDVYFDRRFMFVCNVDNNPSGHSEAVELQHNFPYVNKNGETNMGINVSKAVKVVQLFQDGTRRQESEDYVFCLNVSYSLNSSYVLVLEDDVLPAENALQVLSYTLKYRLQQGQYLNDSMTARKFSHLKLYYPLKWQGFANEPDRILELIAIAILGGTILTLVTQSWLYAKGRYNNASTYHVVVSFIYGVAIMIPLALIIGRVNIISLRHIHPQLYKLGPSPGCCTPAMLYSRDALPGLMNYLIYNNSQAKDLGIYNYTLKQGLPAYQLEPNLFMHTGMVSTLSDHHKKPEEFVYDISVLH